VYTWPFLSPCRVPDIQDLYLWYGDECTWECVVVVALIMYFLEVEGEDDLEQTVVQSIAVDSVGRKGTIRYTRIVNGTGERYGELVVWW
jgi:hypothetical protein